jgi:hypothetical protein
MPLRGPLSAVMLYKWNHRSVGGSNRRDELEAECIFGGALCPVMVHTWNQYCVCIRCRIPVRVFLGVKSRSTHTPWNLGLYHPSIFLATYLNLPNPLNSFGNCFFFIFNLVNLSNFFHKKSYVYIGWNHIFQVEICQFFVNKKKQCL